MCACGDVGALRGLLDPYVFFPPGEWMSTGHARQGLLLQSRIAETQI